MNHRRLEQWRRFAAWVLLAVIGVTALCFVGLPELAGLVAVGAVVWAAYLGWEEREG